MVECTLSTKKIAQKKSTAAVGQAPMYTLIVGVYIAAIVVSTGMASKFFTIGPITLNGSILAWPITFVFNDIFTEVYGYEKSRQIIWTGLFACIFTAFMYGVLNILPSAPFWHDQAAFAAILGIAPRIVAAGLLAYFWGEYTNSVVMSKLKWRDQGAGGAWQGMRFVASTAAGEAVDTAIFYPLAFLGTMPLESLLQTMLFIYAAKVVYEIIALPGSMKLANYIKQREGIDVIDNPATTDYTPMLHVA